MSNPVNSSPAAILSKFAEGTFVSGNHIDIPNTPPTFIRMIVMEVVSDPNTELTLEEKKQKWHSMRVTNMSYADILPRNTIIAKKVGEEENPLFVFPFFPSHLSLPCKPGESVWVMVENPNSPTIEVAYWFCRIVEPHVADDVNHTHPGRASEFTLFPGTKDRLQNDKKGTADTGENAWHELRNSPVLKVGEDRYSSTSKLILMGEDEDVFERLITETDAAALMAYEEVPRFRKRPGDVALEGSNNTLIVLGTDRSGPLAAGDSDMSSYAGSIDIVAGRGQTEDTSGKSTDTTSIFTASGSKKGKALKKELNKTFDVLKATEGDPDMKNDRSRIMVTQRTKVDAKFGLTSYNSEYSKTDNTKDPQNGAIKDSDAGDPAIVIKTDKIRLIARSDLELIVTGYSADPPKAPNGQPRKDEESDAKSWSSIIIKSSGDIVFRPSDTGYIKLGSDKADRALLCTDLPATAVMGKVLPTTAPLSNTMGGQFGGTQIPSQGTWAKKVLVTGANEP